MDKPQMQHVLLYALKTDFLKKFWGCAFKIDIVHLPDGMSKMQK